MPGLSSGLCSWLHISDLHLRTSQTYNTNVVLQALLRDIRDFIQQDDLRPDFITVTGDIAFSGQPAEYTLARRFFDDLLMTTGLPKNRLFVIPGNHDVDRNLITVGAKAVGAALTDRDSTNTLLAIPDDRKLILARLKGYAGFVNDYFAGHLSFDDERYFWCDILDLAGQRIALLGLNSAWLCASDQDKASGLLIGERQVRAALAQAESASLKIALLHHPFDWLREFDRNDAEPLLCSGCDFVLHGHMHQVGLLQARTPDTEAMIIAAGACYETRQYPNSYNFVQLDLSAGKGTVYLRMYSDRQGGFWTNDVVNYRNVPDGIYDFEFSIGKHRPTKDHVKKPDRMTGRTRPSPQKSTLTSTTGESAKVFISYKRGVEPDERLALHLYHFLRQHGHSVFIDQTMTAGTRWASEVQRQIESSDFFLVLLSNASVNSEMVAAEVKCAHRHDKEHGCPRILPIRVAYTDALSYELDAYLGALQHTLWKDAQDTESIAQQVLNAVEGIEILPRKPASFEPRPARIDIPQPLPFADPRLLVDLETPSGVVQLESKFYIEREADIILKREVLKPGALTYIRAARQTGKSSLLVRGVRHAREQKRLVAFVDCQFVDTAHLADLDMLLRCLTDLIASELGVNGVDEVWQSSVTATIKMSDFLEAKILRPAKSPVLLAMDEIDRLYGVPLRNDFFGLVRAWHNRAQWDEVWNKLSIVMAISTEPYLLIDDGYQSPFNVGTKIELEDLNESQVADLNRRHGSPLSIAEVHEMTTFLGGHPYLTRKALYTMLTERLTWSEIVSRGIDERSPFGDHLRRYLWLLRDKPDLVRTLKQVVKSRICPDEVVFHRLQSAGLVRRSDSECVCRCPLYEMFFRRYL